MVCSSNPLAVVAVRKWVPISDGDDDQSPQTGRQRQWSRSRERSYPHAQVHHRPQVQPMTVQEPVKDPDEDPTVVNPSSSTGLSPPVEQRDRSRRQQRSRSHVRTLQRTPPHTPSQSGQQPQHVVPPSGEPQIQPPASQDKDEESETVEHHRSTCRIKKIHKVKEERKQRRKWRS